MVESERNPEGEAVVDRLVEIVKLEDTLKRGTRKVKHGNIQRDDFPVHEERDVVLSPFKRDKLIVQLALLKTQLFGEPLRVRLTSAPDRHDKILRNVPFVMRKFSTRSYSIEN